MYEDMKSAESKHTLLWTDPPYGTDKIQRLADGRYRDPNKTLAAQLAISVIASSRPFLTSSAVIVVCLDDRAIHQTVAGLCDLGFDHLGDIVNESGLGRPRTDWWPRRHVTLATFALGPNPQWDKNAVPRIARQAPKPGYPADRIAGSCWNYTMSNTDGQRTDTDGNAWGYPNQKDLRLISSFILAHTLPGDAVLDPFMGSGSTGVAAVASGRHFTGRDVNPAAIEIALRRIPSARQVNETTITTLSVSEAFLNLAEAA
jgi:16S rRNA G966 N2-methylase RsmD